MYSFCFSNENLPKVNKGTLFTKINERNNLCFCLVHEGTMEEIYEIEFANVWNIYNNAENLVYLFSQEFEYPRCNKLLLLDFKKGIRQELADNVVSYYLSKTGIVYYVTNLNARNLFSLFQYNIKENIFKSLEIDVTKYFDDDGTFYGIDIRPKNNCLWVFFYADASEVMKIKIDENFSLQNVYVASYDEKLQRNVYQYENGEDKK